MVVIKLIVVIIRMIALVVVIIRMMITLVVNGEGDYLAFMVVGNFDGSGGFGFSGTSVAKWLSHLSLTSKVACLILSSRVISM